MPSAYILEKNKINVQPKKYNGRYFDIQVL